MNTNQVPPNSALDSSNWHMTKSVLDQGGLKGSSLLLGPGSSADAKESAFERVLYVAHGSVTATMGAANFMLDADETLVVAAGRELTIRNHGSAPAKVFMLRLPAAPKQVPTLVSLS